MFESFDLKDILDILKRMHIFITVDLAVGEKKRHAYSACLVIAVDETDTWWVLEEFQVKEESYEFAKAVYGFRDKWKPLDVGVENAALQKMFWTVLNLTAEKHGFKPIYALPISATEDKDIATRGLLPRFRVKRIKFLRSLQKTKEQLILFPDYKFRDLIDCLAMGERFCYPPGSSKPKKVRHESWRGMKADTDREIRKEQEDREELNATLENSWDFEMED